MDAATSDASFAPEAPDGPPWTVLLPALGHYLLAVVFGLVAFGFFFWGMGVAAFTDAAGLVVVFTLLLLGLAWLEASVGRGFFRGRRGWRTFVLWSTGIGLALSPFGLARAVSDGDGGAVAMRTLGALWGFAEMVLLLTPSARRHFGVEP